MYSYNGEKIELHVNNYIYLIKRAHNIKIKKNKFINDESTPYDVLAYALIQQYNSDMLYGKYIKCENVLYNGKSVKGNLNIKECINHQSILDGKILGNLYFNQIEHNYNSEIIGMIYKCCGILIDYKEDFHDGQLFKSLCSIRQQLSTLPKTTFNISNLRNKYNTSDLKYIIDICDLILQLDLNREEKESKNRKDYCMALSIRHLIERILRQELGKRLKDIKVYREKFEGGITTPGAQTDINIRLGDTVVIIEVKTGKITRDTRYEYTNQVYGYLSRLRRRYRKFFNTSNGIMLIMEGHVKDGNRYWKVAEIENLEDKFKTDEVTIVSIDFRNPDESVLDFQIQKFSELLYEYLISETNNENIL